MSPAVYQGKSRIIDILTDHHQNEIADIDRNEHFGDEMIIDQGNSEHDDKTEQKPVKLTFELVLVGVLQFLNQYQTDGTEYEYD